MLRTAPSSARFIAFSGNLFSHYNILMGLCFKNPCYNLQGSNYEEQLTCRKEHLLVLPQFVCAVKISLPIWQPKAACIDMFLPLYIFCPPVHNWSNILRALLGCTKVNKRLSSMNSSWQSRTLFYYHYDRPAERGCV